MKKFFTISFYNCLTLILSAQSISFLQDQINYGIINKGADGKKVFTFTNTGNKPLIITNVKSSCDCSVPSWTKQPILPGKSGEITVVYDTKIIGNFSKTIEVFSNDTKTPRKLLKIKGEIK